MQEIRKRISSEESRPRRFRIEKGWGGQRQEVKSVSSAVRPLPCVCKRPRLFSAGEQTARQFLGRLKLTRAGLFLLSGCRPRRKGGSVAHRGAQLHLCRRGVFKYSVPNNDIRSDVISFIFQPLSRRDGFVCLLIFTVPKYCWEKKEGGGPKDPKTWKGGGC